MLCYSYVIQKNEKNQANDKIHHDNSDIDQ